MLDCIWCDCFAQVFPRLNKDSEGAATNLRAFTETGWSGFPEGKAGCG